jgi:hypothetical protein
VVLANSLCGNVQALVDDDGAVAYPDRDSVVHALANRIADLAVR